jgi:hypothetical protein
MKVHYFYTDCHTVCLWALKATHTCSFKLIINPALCFNENIPLTQSPKNIKEGNTWCWEIFIGVLKYHDRN